MPKLMNLQEFADALRVKPSTVRSWVRWRTVNYLKIAHSLRFEPAELERILREGRRPMNGAAVEAPKVAEPAQPVEPPKRREFFVP